MKLLLEINEAAETLIKTTASLQELMDITGLGIEPINEAVTTFLSSKASQIEGGKFVQPKGMSDEEWQQSRENVINIYTAVHALTDMNTAMSLQPAGGNASGGTEIDQNAVPIGSVLDKFYGSDGDQAHKVAKARLIEIGRTVSPSLRQQAASTSYIAHGEIQRRGTTSKHGKTNARCRTATFRSIKKGFSPFLVFTHRTRLYEGIVFIISDITNVKPCSFDGFAAFGSIFPAKRGQTCIQARIYD